MHNHIILYDGFCELCSKSIRFIIKRDKEKLFTYFPLQSKEGKSLLASFNINSVSVNTFVYINNGEAYQKSTAALSVCKNIKGLKWIAVFLIIPKFIRDAVYSFVANNRYRWFGKNETCYLP